MHRWGHEGIISDIFAPVANLGNGKVRNNDLRIVDGRGRKMNYPHMPSS